MLSTEDQAVLGMAAEWTGPQPAAPLAGDSDHVYVHAGYRVRVASDRETRERAYQLAYRVYLQKGYITPDDRGLVVSAFDTAAETLTVLVEDETGHEAGTISLVFDADAGLPCDEIFGSEADTLRSRGRRLVEVTRLAIDTAHAHSRALLTLLCNVPFAYGMRVGGCTDLVIEVNPRHVAFYERLMQFKAMGRERPCPRVQGAPAILLRADLRVYQAEMRRLGGLGAACTKRSLLAHFLAGAREWEFARFLACRQQRMSEMDAQYFGLERPMPFKRTMWSAAG